MRRRLKLKVYGLVQGVSFRQTTKNKAEELGLTGWVKNCNHNRVEIVAEGRQEDLYLLLRWVQEGTRWSRVDKIEKSWAEDRGEFDYFEIKY